MQSVKQASQTIAACRTQGPIATFIKETEGLFRNSFHSLLVSRPGGAKTKFGMCGCPRGVCRLQHQQFRCCAHLHLPEAWYSLILGLYRDNGDGNGNYRDYMGLYRSYIGYNILPHQLRGMYSELLLG